MAVRKTRELLRDSEIGLGEGRALLVVARSGLNQHVLDEVEDDEILQQSKKLDCDLIVMGTHRKGVAHTFLGSVSKRVMSNSRIPVLVVPLPAE